jgi:glycosyltransferase involved in cell wall biosynthesis
MKIAMIDPSLFTWPYDIALARGLMAHGHEVTVYGRKSVPPLPDDEHPYLDAHFYKSVEGNWARRIPSNLFLILKGISHITSMLRLAARLWRNKPDIIHFQWTPLAVVDIRMLPLFRRIAPLVFTIHDSTPFNDNPKSKLQIISATSIMTRFDGVIVHTANAAERVTSYGVSPHRIRRIAHGILNRLVDPEILEGQKPDGTPIELLLFGQIKPYKGVDILLEAFAHLPRNWREHCRLRIVGRPQMEMEPIFALVERLDLARLVEFDLRFIGEDEIGGILRAADIHMFPYTEIDASGVLMLALGVGKPIIASNIGYFCELLEDGVHGALVPPGNVEALSAAMITLIADPVRRLEMGANVAELRNAIPGWDLIGEQTLDLYNTLIAEQKQVGIRTPSQGTGHP